MASGDGLRRSAKSHRRDVGSRTCSLLMKLPANPPLEVLSVLKEAGHAIQGMAAYSSTQRHRSWRVSTHDGAFWIKLEAQASPVAGVEREALILRSLRRHFS